MLSLFGDGSVRRAACGARIIGCGLPIVWLRRLPVLALVESEGGVQFRLARQQFAEPRFVLEPPPRLLLKLPQILPQALKPLTLLRRDAPEGAQRVFDALDRPGRMLRTDPG